MKLLKLCIITVLSLSLQACAASNSAKTAQGTGLTKEYVARFDRTFTASVDAVKATNGEIVEENKAEGNIVATYGITPFSWGERVAVFIESLSANKTEVEVVSKRAVATNITAANWETKIHDKIAENLKQ